MKYKMWLTAVVLAVSAGVAAAQGNEMDAYLQGLSAQERAAFPRALQQSVLETSQDVLGGLRRTQNSKVRNKDYSVFLLREMVQRKIEAKEFALSRQRTAAAMTKMRAKVLKGTADFLEELGPEVDRLARESHNADELSTRLLAVSDHVEDWAGGSKSGSGLKAGASAARAGGKLSPTDENIEGPFYRPNAPFTNVLIPAGQSGSFVVISGRVLDVNGEPIAGAVVDVWLADPQGAYDIANPRDRNNPDIPYKFRGRIRADARGAYSFRTLLPGNYEIGEDQWRCKHIHYKVNAPGFRPLTTQLYFNGDRFNATDPWWKASTSIPLAGGDGTQTGAFDVVLAPKAKS